MKEVRLNARLSETLHANLKAALAKKRISIQDWIIKLAKKETGEK